MLTCPSESYPEIHDKYLSISNENVGIYDSQQPVVVYSTPGAGSDLVSLHTYPIGIVDHALALTGTNGLYDLKDTMPQVTDPAPDATFSWREFVLQEDSSTVLWRAGSQGKWVVFPGADQGTFEVKWNDGMCTRLFGPDEQANSTVGTGFTTQNFLPIEVAFEVVNRP